MNLTKPKVTNYKVPKGTMFAEQTSETDLVKVVFEPGNGKFYEIIFVRVTYLGARGLGFVDDGWLTILAWNKTAHLLNEHAKYLAKEYVADSFKLKNEEDILYHTFLIATFLGRETDAKL